MKFKEQHIFKTNTSPHPGCLLLADPFLDQEHFVRAVILLIEHNQDESFGLVLNHPTELHLNDVTHLSNLNLPIYSGGPVGSDQLFYLHRFSNIDGALQINEQLYFGGEWQQVLKKAQLAKAPQKQLRIFRGYAGWCAQQLEDELAEHAWICLPKIDEKTWLHGQASTLWKRYLLDLGPDLSVFAHFPLHLADN